MKLKDGFLLRQVAGENVVIPIRDGMKPNMMITLNGTGAFLWQLLGSQTDEEALMAALMAEYGIDRELANKAVTLFLDKLREHGFLEE